MSDSISRCELFNRLATIPAPPEANEFKAEVYKVIQEMETETADIILCKDCKYWVSDGGALMICDIHKDPTVHEHFCSYGGKDDE